MPKIDLIDGALHDLRGRRLPNWGRFARINPCAPDGSCANPLYEMMVRRDDDGYGQIDASTILATRIPPPPAPDPIDELDAEMLDKLIQGLIRGHRAILANRYVLMAWVAPNPLTDAIKALGGALAESQRIIHQT